MAAAAFRIKTVEPKSRDIAPPHQKKSKGENRPTECLSRMKDEHALYSRATLLTFTWIQYSKRSIEVNERQSRSRKKPFISNKGRLRYQLLDCHPK